MHHPLATLKRAMTDDLPILERNLRKMNYNRDPKDGIIVHTNPEYIPHPDLYILLAHMRLHRLDELKTLPFKSVHEVLCSLSQEWIDTLKDTFFDPAHHWTINDVHNRNARIFFLKLGHTPYMNAIGVKDLIKPQYRTDWATTLGFHKGFMPQHLSESTRHLFLHGDQSISWNEHIKMEANSKLKGLIENIETVTLLNGYGIPAQLTPKHLHLAGASSLKNLHSPLHQVEEFAFVSTGIKTDALAYIVNKTPNLKRLIIANEAYVEKLPESLSERDVSIAAIFSPIATIGTQHSQKIEKLLRSGREELINSGLALLDGLKDTPSSVRVGNRMVPAEPLVAAFRYIQMVDNLDYILLGSRYEPSYYTPRYNSTNYVHVSKMHAMIRRRNF